MQDDGGVSRQRELPWGCIPKAMSLLPLVCNMGRRSKGRDCLLGDVVVLNARCSTSRGIHGHRSIAAVP